MFVQICVECNATLHVLNTSNNCYLITRHLLSHRVMNLTAQHCYRFNCYINSVYLIFQQEVSSSPVKQEAGITYSPLKMFVLKPLTSRSDEY